MIEVIMKVKQNAILAVLAQPMFHQRTVPARKGKGSYNRKKDKHEHKL